jgi:hypothetical protein
MGYSVVTSACAASSGIRSSKRRLTPVSFSQNSEGKVIDTIVRDTVDSGITLFDAKVGITNVSISNVKTGNGFFLPPFPPSGLGLFVVNSVIQGDLTVQNAFWGGIFAFGSRLTLGGNLSHNGSVGIQLQGGSSASNREP